MPSQAGSLQISIARGPSPIACRAGLALAALLGVLALVATWAPAAAHAAGCEDTFTNTAGGSWSTGANWSKKAPPASGEEACITEPGTYTVTLTASSASVKSLTLGASSGTQTLSAESSPSGNASLSSSAGIGVGAHGVLTLTNTGISANADILSGATVLNEGTISVLAGTSGGERRLEASIDNRGTVALATGASYPNGSDTFTNEGALKLESGSLTVNSSAAFTNGAGGSIAASAGDSVFLDSSATYNQGAGTTSGADPVIAEASNIDFTGAGSSVIHEQSYYSHISGNIASGQTLVAEGCVGSDNPSILVASKSFENAGTLEFASSKYKGGDCSSSDRTDLKLETGVTLTNTGTILVEPGTGGERLFEGGIVNKGTVEVNASASDTAGLTTFTNEGEVDLASSATFRFENSTTFANESGSVKAGGTSELMLGGSATYDQGDGSTSGDPVVAEASNINFTGTGSSTIHEQSYYSHISGNIASSQTLVAEGCVGSDNPSILVASKSFENAGTLEFASSKYKGGDCSSSDRTDLKLESGVKLTNTGTILVEPGTGGERLIEGAIANKGTVDINATTGDTAGSTTFTNEGTVNLATSTIFKFESSTTFTNGGGGLIDAVGDSSVVLGDSSTFNQGAGSAIGNEPILAEASNLNFTGTGSSVIHERGYYGYIGGSIAHDQTLVVEGCVGSSNPGIVVVGKTLENAGTIEFTSAKYKGGDCGGSDRTDLKIETGATFTNAGTILIEPGIGGERVIEGAFENERFLSLSDAAPLTVSGTFTQGTNGTLIEPIASTSSYGKVAVSGKASLGGTLDLQPLGGFKGELGQKFTPITDASHENAFIHEENAVISTTAPGLWYKPVYEPISNSTTEFGLLVAEGSPPEKPPVNEVKPSISGTPKQGDTLVAQPGTWKGEEATAYSYQWLRCTATGTECTAISGAYYRDYLLTGADAGHRLTVAVTAYNEAGGSAAAEPAAPTEVIAALPLRAKAGETVEGIEGSPVTLDGSGSTPSSEITDYRWTFAPGVKEEGPNDAIVHHTYAAAGTYEAQLTVSGKAEEASATVTVKIHPKPKPAEGAVVDVQDGGGPVQGASVLFVGPTGTRIEAQSSASGEAVLAGLPEGNDSVYVYESGEKPAVATIAVDAAGDGSTTVTLSSGEITTEKLESKELTYEEVVKAGINPYAPENQNVYSFTVKLAFIESPTPPVEVHGYVNGGGQFVGATGGGGGGGGAWSCGTTSCESPGLPGNESEQIVATPEVVEHHPLIQWLILKGKAAVLKQFFEVSMVVQNLSPKPFTLSAGDATLNLPAGLSLAPTTKAQHLTEETPAIEGETSYTANWIIRGDTPGEYPNLSATYDSTLEPFLAPVDVSAALAQPLKVWGKEALQLKVKADEGKLHPGVPYHVWIGVKNVADVPLYNLGLSIDEEPHVNFLFQPDQQFSEVAAEVKPGETFWVKNPYILIPNEESESVFNPALSSITFDGEKEHPGENIEKVPVAEQPHLYSVSAVPDTPGYVHLKWTAVPGAEGYEVFSTKPLVSETPFSTVPRKVFASSSLTGAVEELPGTATEAYVPAGSSETLGYAVSTITGGHHELESSPVVETSAPAAEFGRCLKVAAGKGQYGGSSCTTAGGGKDYTWYPAFGGSKPLSEVGFTTAIKAPTELKLETKSKKIACTGEASTGDYSGVRTVADVAMTMTGCKKVTSKSSESCQSSGANAGEVVSSKLDGELGIVEASAKGPAENKIGLDLAPASGTVVAEFSCGSTSVLVKGSVIVPVTADKMITTQTLKYTQSQKIQRPSRFVDGPEDVLQAQFGTAGLEQMGLTLTTVQKSEESVEVNSEA